MNAGATSGLVTRRSRYPFDETIVRLTSEIEARGARMFAVIDHAAEAQRVGLTMPPTKVLVFGNPRAGTGPMLAAPSLAIDLPLKILVWQEGTDVVWMVYNSAEYLAARHALPHTQSAALKAADGITGTLMQA